LTQRGIKSLVLRLLLLNKLNGSGCLTVFARRQLN
jgi:hypothetical protein